ncbi:uncharacterized protein LJ264_013858 isoform 2-T2 [Porphyrio hochstetteri]
MSPTAVTTDGTMSPTAVTVDGSISPKFMSSDGTSSPKHPECSEEEEDDDEDDDGCSSREEDAEEEEDLDEEEPQFHTNPLFQSRGGAAQEGTSAAPRSRDPPGPQTWRSPTPRICPRDLGTPPAPYICSQNGDTRPLLDPQPLWSLSRGGLTGTPPAPVTPQG